jgi:hypothetical protein
MNFPFRRKKLTAQQAQTVWDSSTVRDAEKNRHTYRPQDVAAQESVRRALGVVHDCAATNARVCASIPLRLLRRTDAAGGADRRSYRGKNLNIADRKAFASGSMGKNVAAFMEAGGEVEEVQTHPILDLLASPCDEMVGVHVAWYSFYFREICGKSYEMVGRGDAGIEALLPMPAQFVDLRYDDNGHSGYLYGRSETHVAQLELDDVIMYRHAPSRFNPYDGEGPLAGVLPEADLLVQNIMHDLAFVGRGNRPDSMLTIDGVKTTPDQLDELERRINSKFGGAANQHRTYVASGNVSWTPFVWPEKELQSMTKIEHYEKRVRSAFGHTESMADSNDSTYASALVGYSEQYMGAAIRPRLIADAAQKNEFLLPLFGLDPEVYTFVYDDPVKRDEAVIADRSRNDAAAGILTINEARAERNLDPIDDPGADVLRVNGQTLESLDDGGGFGLLGGGISTPPQFSEDNDVQQTQGQKVEETALNGAQIAQLVDLASKVSIGELTTEAARGIAIAAFPGIPPEKIDGIFDKLAQGSVSPDDVKAAGGKTTKHAVAMIFKGMHDDELPEWTRCGCDHKDDDDVASDPLMRRIFREHMKPIESEFERVVREMQDEVIRSERDANPADLRPIIDRAAGELREAMIDIVAEGIKDTLELAGQDVDSMFDVVNREAMAFFESHTIRVAEDIADTTESMIRPAIARGIENGLSINEIAGELDGLPAYRAERIARTEVQNAAQGARYQTLGEVGVEQIEWVTAPGASAAHKEIAKRGPKNIGEPFVKAGETIKGEKFSRNVYHPPARPNCRCSIRAIFPEG